MKRKAAEKELEDLRNQRQVLGTVCHSLENEADKCAEMAEGKAGTKMAELITKSNTLRRRHKDKKSRTSPSGKIYRRKGGTAEALVILPWELLCLLLIQSIVYALSQSLFFSLSVLDSAWLVSSVEVICLLMKYCYYSVLYYYTLCSCSF